MLPTLFVATDEGFRKMEVSIQHPRLRTLCVPRCERSERLRRLSAPQKTSESGQSGFAACPPLRKLLKPSGEQALRPDFISLLGVLNNYKWRLK